MPQRGSTSRRLMPRKRRWPTSLETTDRRVLNRLGAFATLFDASFPGYQHPVLVLKTEEPGSKQKLALAHDRVESLCHDLVNHLINDIIVMGAHPLSVQDAIICGHLDGPIVNRLVAGLAEACRAPGLQPHRRRDVRATGRPR